MKKFLKYAELGRRWGVSKPTIWRMWAERKEIPPPYTVGKTILGWPLDLIEEIEGKNA